GGRHLAARHGDGAGERRAVEDDVEHELLARCDREVLFVFGRERRKLEAFALAFAFTLAFTFAGAAFAFPGGAFAFAAVRRHAVAVEGARGARRARRRRAHGRRRASRRGERNS